ncbi:MAG: glutamate racemase [Myxococcota bacterium]
MSRKELPIGVFDSGVGGLTVVRAMRDLLPHEDIIYLGDTARVPYGSRSPETVARYAQRVAGHLLRRGIKALVVACNTATTYGLESLSEVGDTRGIPVIGVIDPGVKAALSATTTGHIGIIGTEGTIKGGAYTSLLKQRRPDLSITTKACPLFVALAEEGWTDGDIAQAVATRYLSDLKDGPDTLILGCTHYPLLTNAIAATLPGVKLVDSATSTANTVAQVLTANNLARSSGVGHTRYLVTDNKQRFLSAGSRFLGTEPTPTEVVDIDDADQAAWQPEVAK